MYKVVFLTTIPSPYRVDFFNEWGKICDLTVIFEKDSSSERSDLWKNLDIHNFKPVFLKGISVRANKAFAPGVIKLLKEIKYDAFIIGGYNTPTAMLVAEWLRYHKVPYILNADGGYAKNDKFFIEKIKRRYISGASEWICTSSKTIEYFLHYGAERERIHKYPFTSIRKNKVLERPLTDDEKNIIRNKLGITEEKVILSVGQFIHRKGFDILLNAAKNLEKSIGLYLIGGKPTSEYISITEKYNLENVHFLDFMSSDNLAEYYKAADLFVFPTREDIWGLVINEAAAYGLPIVTTYECIAGLEMVSDANGILIPTEDEKALSEAIKLILTDESKAKSMAEASLMVANDYTVEKMAKCHNEVIEGFVNGEREDKN